MQYIKDINLDLKSGHTTYFLGRNIDYIDFCAYNAKYAIGADKFGQKLNNLAGGRFLRKGFDSVLEKLNSKVCIPEYKDIEGKYISVSSVEEARHLIYEGKIVISKFRFVEGTTEEERDEEFSKLIDDFVLASKNLDFSSDENLFIIGDVKSSCEISYNNGGSEKVVIESVDIQEKLGLETKAVKKHKLKQNKMRQRSLIDR